MTAVNCPMCELRFATRTERDWHLRNEHHHPHRTEAPVEPARPAAVTEAASAGSARERRRPWWKRRQRA